MSIFEKRQAIIQSQNTAQDEFETLLSSYPINTNEIIVNKQLHGDLDLDIIKTRGYTAVRSISFTPPDPTQRGEITNITNIPTYVRKFVAVNQMLTDINLFLPYTEELVLEQNYLTTLNVNTLVRCKKMVLNMNGMTELKGVPKTLEELYVNDNLLKTFDFNNTPNLRVFHCVNNPQIKLVNVPRGNIDIQMDEASPVSSTMHYAEEDASPTGVSDKSVTKSPAESTALRNLNYDECLRGYFKLKSKYDADEMAERRKMYDMHHSHKQGKQASLSVIPQCIKCKRRVGSVFTMKNNRFVAVCGSKTKPCDLRIELFRGNYDNLNGLIKMYKDTLEDQKEDIIRQKMDTLFNFVDEREAVRLFKTKLEDYNKNSGMYKDYVDVYMGLFENKHKQTLVKTKMENVYRLKEVMTNLANEFERNGNRVALQTLVGIYEKEYAPEIMNLRRLHHEVMEMNELDENTQILFQHSVALSRLDYLWGEEPRVIAYSA